MPPAEQAVIFPHEGEQLLGILHRGAADARLGVLVVVGGPQYRVGSHRQFLLLARDLAAEGVPVFRFDYRGMGDSSGNMRGFEDIEGDIGAAIDQFQRHHPGLEQIVIWGLCDAASAGLLYAWRDPRVTGLVLVNPWIRTEEGLARAYLKSYYLQRLTSRDFWTSLATGRVNPANSVRSLLQMTRKATASRHPDKARKTPAAQGEQAAAPSHLPRRARQPLPERMAESWQRFRGPILLVLSGQDLTATEFLDTANRSPAWRGLLERPNLQVKPLPEANHTFSRDEWRTQVSDWTLAWLENPTTHHRRTATP